LLGSGAISHPLPPFSLSSLFSLDWSSVCLIYIYSWC
jgi:hypothetical protein